MKENLTDKEKLEIEKHVDEILKKKLVGIFHTIDSGLSSLAGIGLLLGGIFFLFLYWILGLVMIIIGVLFLGSANKSQEKIKQIRKEKKEQLIKEFQLKALKEEKWKDK